MIYSKLKSTMLAQFCAPNGHKTVFFITGVPGAGKSALSADVANELATLKGIPPERVVTFNPSLREPCDVLGLPDVKGEFTRWVPAQEFFHIRRGQGPSILRIEELSDADVSMQNCMCRIILDRFAGELPLSDELYIICTGNRVEDRSGANRMTTKLSNRMRTIEFMRSDSECDERPKGLEDWKDWAFSHGVDPVLVGFLLFRNNLWCDFKPDRSVNPTPRSWENVSRIPLDLISTEDAIEHIAGDVGRGPAIEYMAFRHIFNTLPDIEEIYKAPAKAKVPEDTDVRYALAIKLMFDANIKTIDKLWLFIKRMPEEFVVLIMNELRKSLRGITSTKAFVEFSVKYASTIV